MVVIVTFDSIDIILAISLIIYPTQIKHFI